VFKTYFRHVVHLGAFATALYGPIFVVLLLAAPMAWWLDRWTASSASWWDFGCRLGPSVIAYVVLVVSAAFVGATNRRWLKELLRDLRLKLSFVMKGS
jgi:hypothetical protein